MSTETRRVNSLGDAIAEIRKLRDSVEHDQLALYVGHTYHEDGQLLGYDEACLLPIEELRKRMEADDWGAAWELHNGEDIEWHYTDEGAMQAYDQALAILDALQSGGVE
jgi:hypothetical protein